MIIKCPTCGKDFDDYGGRRKHCSVACNNRDPINREKSRKRITELNKTEYFKKMNHDKMTNYNKTQAHKEDAKRSIMKFHKIRYDRVHANEIITLYLIISNEGFLKIGITHYDNIITRWNELGISDVSKIYIYKDVCNIITELEYKVKSELYDSHLDLGTEYFDLSLESKIKEICNVDWIDYPI